MKKRPLLYTSVLAAVGFSVVACDEAPKQTSEAPPANAREAARQLGSTICTHLRTGGDDLQVPGVHRVEVSVVAKFEAKKAALQKACRFEIRVADDEEDSDFGLVFAAGPDEVAMVGVVTEKEGFALVPLETIRQ